jgi:hypothetical protein
VPGFAYYVNSIDTVSKIEGRSIQSGRGLIAARHSWFSFYKRNRHGKDASQYYYTGRYDYSYDDHKYPCGPIVLSLERLLRYRDSEDG